MGGIFGRLPVVKFDWNKTITGKDRSTLVKHVEKDTVTGKTYWFGSTLILIGVVILSIIRSTELWSLFATSLMYLGMYISVLGATTSLFLSPPRALNKLGKRLTVIFMVIVALKREIDWDLAKNLISYSADDGGMYDLQGRVVIITGANSGLGLGATELFASYGATVVMGCRNEQKCEVAKQDVMSRLASRTAYVGPLVPEKLDLSDLASVHDFAKRIMKTYEHVDILVNNAGGVPEPGLRSAQGFELSWGSMHLGHFALTKWLLPQMLKLRPATNKDDIPLSGHYGEAAKYFISDSARIVTVSSDAFLAGSFHASLMHGNGTGLGDLHGEIIDNCDPNSVCCPIGNCPDSNSYARAKLSNVLHSYELQKRIDEHAYNMQRSSGSSDVRRVVTASLHPGAVASNIHPVFSNKFTNWPLRDHLIAARLIVYAAMEQNILPGAFIDGAALPHDLFDYYSDINGLNTHVAVWPEAKKLPFYRTSHREYNNAAITSENVGSPSGVGQGMSYHKWLFDSKSLVHSGEKWGIKVNIMNFVNKFPLSIIPLFTHSVTAVVRCVTSVIGFIDRMNILQLHETEHDKKINIMLNDEKLLEKKTVSARLWEVSNAIVKQYESGSAYLAQPVATSTVGLDF
jgi:NAD(P)-dependent dehydrogenase (short-subunit alcohol dehydrogenase family)